MFVGSEMTRLLKKATGQQSFVCSEEFLKILGLALPYAFQIGDWYIFVFGFDQTGPGRRLNQYCTFIWCSTASA